MIPSWFWTASRVPRHRRQLAPSNLRVLGIISRYDGAVEVYPELLDIFLSVCCWLKDVVDLLLVIMLITFFKPQLD